MKFIDSDFLNLKIKLREFIYTITPENKEKLENSLTDIDNLINKAWAAKLKNEGYIK